MRPLSDSWKPVELLSFSRTLTPRVDAAITAIVGSYPRSSRVERTLAGGLEWQVRGDLLTPTAGTILSDPDHFLIASAEILKDGRRSTVGRGHGFVLKRYTRRGVKAFKDWFRRSRGCSDFQKACLLEAAGVAASRAVACTVKREIRGVIRSYFLMIDIAPAISFRTAQPTFENVEAVARLLASMHESGFTHRDLNNDNILFDSTGCPHLIDLEQVHHAGFVSDAQAKEDIKKLLRAKGSLPAYIQTAQAEFMALYGAFRQEQSASSRTAAFHPLKAAFTYFPLWFCDFAAELIPTIV